LNRGPRRPERRALPGCATPRMAPVWHAGGVQLPLSLLVIGASTEVGSPSLRPLPVLLEELPPEPVPVPVPEPEFVL
jgi:hypothetical protein